MLDISKIIVVEDRAEEGQKQVFVQPGDLYPAAIARLKELLTLVKESFVNLEGWAGAGITGQMRFALEKQISNAELPLIISLFAVPEATFEDALLPVWELPQANLPKNFAEGRDKDERRLAARAWLLECALALFLREMREHATRNKFTYNTEIGRDLRYSLKWVSAESE